MDMHNWQFIEYSFQNGFLLDDRVDSLTHPVTQGTKVPASLMKKQAEKLRDLLKVAYLAGGGTIWSRPPDLYAIGF